MLQIGSKNRTKCDFNINGEATILSSCWTSKSEFNVSHTKTKS